MFCPKIFAAVVAALALSGASPALAQDAVPDATGETVQPSWTAASAESCTDPDVGLLLASFGDFAWYSPAPGGDFESAAAGWQLSGGASVVRGSNFFLLGDHALQLPVGASAISPTFCVDERYPTFRFALAQYALRADAKVKVEVIYPGSEKNVRGAASLDARAGRGWGLSPHIDLKPTYGLESNAWRLVAIRLSVLKADSGSDVRIDDVVIDPMRRT